MAAYHQVDTYLDQSPHSMDPVDRMVAALATQDGVPYVYRLDEADSHAFMVVPSFSPDHPYSSLLTNPSQKPSASPKIL